MYILYSVYDKKKSRKKDNRGERKKFFNVIFKEEREKYFRELQGRKYVKLEIKNNERERETEKKEVN